MNSDDANATGALPFDSPLVIGRHSFGSRLFVGTGRYDDFATMRAAIEASGSECVTVAVRRVGLLPGDGAQQSQGGSLLAHLDLSRITLLPNTAGCYTADEAVRTARLAREALDSELVKLEVLADPETLLPDPLATLAAAATLVAEGFTVLAYTSDDPVVALRLEQAGVAAVMPLGAPIGSNRGLRTRELIEILVDRIDLPIIVDAGIGKPSEAAEAMEMGVDAVLLNTAIASSEDPVAMARAFRLAIEAGRLAYLAGPGPTSRTAKPSSPLTGFLDQP